MLGVLRNNERLGREWLLVSVSHLFGGRTQATMRYWLDKARGEGVPWKRIYDAVHPAIGNALLGGPVRKHSLHWLIVGLIDEHFLED